MSNLKQNVKVLNSFSLYSRGKSRYVVVLWLRRNAIIYIQQGKRENLEKKKNQSLARSACGKYNGIADVSRALCNCVHNLIRVVIRTQVKPQKEKKRMLDFKE